MRKYTHRPEDTRYHVLMLGAGLQSSLIAHMAIEGELKLDLIIFADTGCEPEWVYRKVSELERLSNSAGIEFIIANNGNLMTSSISGERIVSMPFYVLKNGRGVPQRRQCTNEYKIVPCDRALLRWLESRGDARKNARGQIRVRPGVRVSKYFGITTDETRRIARARVSWQTFCYPLIEVGYSRSDCIKWFAQRNISIPRKSSCIVCPYHDASFWAELKRDAPEQFRKAVEYDNFLRSNKSPVRKRFGTDVYLHSSCIPLSEVVIEVDGLSPDQRIAQEAVLGCIGNAGFSCWT